jgi:nucleoid DNA-binding protein
MYGELYQYLILHKQLHLPGIGTFAVEKKPADFDVAAQVINPPAYTIALQADHTTPAKTFFNWLGARLGISERDAVIRFNDFLFDLKRQLSSGNKLQWSGVGTLSKGLNGDIKLEFGPSNYSPGTPVHAAKVLRQNAEHVIRVGEQEKTSVEMQELLSHQDDEKKSWWWVAAIILVILSILFIGYYFSTNGLTTSAVSNQQKLVPQQQTSY